MSCEHVIDVEDWTLDLLSAEDAARIAAHIATCDACQEARAMFVEERALFTRSAPAFSKPPALALPRRSFIRARTVSTIAALAACVAAVFGGAHAFAPDDCAAPTKTVEAPAQGGDEPLTCPAPVADGHLFSELTPAPLASHEPATLACIDRASCDLQGDTL